MVETFDSFIPLSCGKKVCFEPYKAGELSLMAALCNGDLVKSHMKLGRVQPEPQAKSDVL